MWSAPRANWFACSARIGANAHALVGGSGNSFALQPLSLEGQQGVNLAAGVAGLELRYADHGPYKKVRKAHAHHAQR